MTSSNAPAFLVMGLATVFVVGIYIKARYEHRKMKTATSTNH